MPNIYIQSVKIHTSNPWAINFQWTKDYEPNDPQSVVHWKENLQSSLLIILFPKSISLNHTAYTELAFQNGQTIGQWTPSTSENTVTILQWH